MLVSYTEAVDLSHVATVTPSRNSNQYTIKFYPNGIINPSTLPSYSNALKSALLVSDENEKLCLRTHLKKNDILHGSIIMRDNIYTSIMGDNENIELWTAYVNSFYNNDLCRYITINYICPERKKEMEEEAWGTISKCAYNDGLNQAYVTFDENYPTMKW